MKRILGEILLLFCVWNVRVTASMCPNDCSGHGFCLKQGVCMCSNSWTGFNCATPKCPQGTAWADFALGNDNAHNLADCSNRGKCDTSTGLCSCLPGFTGLACERLSCSCNGRGSCLSVRNYALTKDAGIGQMYPYDTNWDANKIHGCVCDPPYTGYSCQLTECPRGDDPLTGTIYDPVGLQYNERQIVNCKATGGSFTLTFRGQTTVPIFPTDTAATVQTKLFALPNINGIAVSYSGITTQACTILGNNIVLEFTQDFGNLPTVVGDASGLVHSSAGMTPTLAITTSIDGTKENALCSNRGLCDRTSGICACFANFFSSDGNGNIGTRGDCGYATAAITQCPGSVLACSGHGICQGPPTYTCICASGFQGGDCSERICPVGKAWFDMPYDSQGAHQLVECSNAGVCDRSKGDCVCDPRFTGASCNRLLCPNECSGHGTCQTIQAMAGLSKINGDPTKFTYGAIPNYYPTWDFDQTQGCVCNPGYSGHDCSLQTCPTGDDPLTTIDVSKKPQANTIQVLRCIATGGTFTLSFRGQVTPAMVYTTATGTLSAALNALTEFGTVTVRYSSGITACTGDGSNFISITFMTVFGPLPNIRTTLNGVTSITVSNDGSNGSVVGTKEDAICSNRGTCDTLHGICICTEGFTSSDGYGRPGSRGDCGYMEPVYLNSAAKVANEIEHLINTRSMAPSKEEGMVTKLFAGFLCVCCWLHGATVGVAVGDALDLAQFFVLSLAVCFVITAIYPTSRRLAASILFLACAIFLSSLVKSLVFFRTPNHPDAVLPDIGHDFLPPIPIPPQVLLLFVGSATAIFITFHPLKLVIMRRLLLIYATLLMARTVLALMTFLPDSNPNCLAEEKSVSAKQVVHHFLVSRKGFVEWFDQQRNTTLHGCRDSIYCGHATILVLCGMTWHTYYQRVEAPVNWVKSIVWIFSIMAMVSSLGRREAYTLDVVLSTYFAVTTWATYHRLANDVLTGHVFTAVWLIDKMIIYPLVEWMEEEGVPKKQTSNMRLYRRDTMDDNEVVPSKKKSTYSTY